jgi:Major Facilitator Superfamily
MAVSETAAEKPPRFERLLGDFGKFFAGQTISNLGNSVTMFAVPILVYSLTGSALDLGLASAVQLLPYLLFGLVIGAWVDRVDRRRLMIAADLDLRRVVHRRDDHDRLRRGAIRRDSEPGSD